MSIGNYVTINYTEDNFIPDKIIGKKDNIKNNCGPDFGNCRLENMSF